MDALSEHDTTLPDPISRHDEDTLLDAREGTVEAPLDIDINNQFDDPSYEDAPRDLHLSDRGIIGEDRGWN